MGQGAAQQWKLYAALINAENGVVTHGPSGRHVSYGELVDRAAALSPPKEVTLKDPKDFRLIGRPLKRLDTPDKVNGKVLYGIDAMPTGVQFATLASSPVFGGKVGQVDDTKAKALAGPGGGGQTYWLTAR